MSGSTGQIIGYVAGAVIGYFTGGLSYVALGAAVGGAIGGAIDPPKGPKIVGPKLSDLSVQTNTYGANIPKVWGTLATFGNIFWVENNQLKETTTSETQGGKGGGGQETETTTYSVTFALGLCQGPIEAVKRIWCSGKLIYDAGATDYEGIVASNLASSTFRLYLGTEDQLPDWRMQAALGVANVPAYRGLAYIVFDDFQLKDFGNSILGAQFKVEVVTSAVDADPQLLSDSAIRDDPYYWGTGIINIGGETELARFQCAADEWYGGEQYKEYTCKASLSFIETAGLYMDVSHAAPPGKYPWLTSVLWLPGSSVGGNGWRYGGLNYVYDSMGTGVTDWVVLPSTDANVGRLIMIRANVLEMYLPGSGVATSYAVAGATQMYYTFGYIIVVATGTTWAFDTDLVLLYSSSNSLSMSNKMLGGSNDGGLYLMDMASAQLGPNIYPINGSVSAITGTYATEIVTSAGGSPAFYVRDGILIVAFVDDPEPSVGGHQVAFTVRRWGLGGLGGSTVNLSTIISDVCLSSNLIEAGDIDVTAIDQQVKGYRVTETAALRAGLESLQAAWPFDVLQGGYKIKFVPRGGASIASVAESDLGATDGKAITRLTSAREMDSQLPRRVELSYFDVAREYDTGEQAAERLNTDAINTLKMELPIVLNATEAAGMAEVLLYLYWLERHDLSFILPPTFQQLEPADVITIATLGGSHEVRLTSINNLPDGRLECAGKYNHAAVYVPTAVGEESLAPGQTLTSPGPTELMLLDAPCVSEAMDQPGFVAAACGYNAGWKGATVYETADGGQTWSSIAGFTLPGSVFGTARDSLSGGRYDIIDPCGRLTFQVISGSLSSVSDAALFAGSNTFAYGAHGRWEIIGAKTCTQNTDGSWSLGNLLRGRFGTEWAASLHVAGDSIVLINSATPFIGQVTSSIGSAKTFRGVTSGRGIDTASDLSFIYQGGNLECVAPVYLNGSRNVSTLDWTLTWVRRTRVGGEWRDFVDAPLGEPAENYVIEIWDGSSYLTLKRTLTSTTPTKTYTNAQQVTDFGAAVATLYVKVYQVSATVGNGIPLVTSISRALVPSQDYLWAYVSSLLHFDGANNSTTFTDQKGKTWTRSGAPVISTAQSRFGGSSGYFTGAQSINTPNHADFNFGAGDFCIEWSAYYTTVPGGSGSAQTIIRKWTTTNQQCFDVWMYYLGSGITQFRFSISTTGADTVTVISSNSTTDSWAIPANTWTKWAVFRYGNTVYFTVDGVVKNSAVFTSTIFAGTSQVELGNGDGSSLSVFYVEEFRATKTGRYSGAYTPISAPFQDA